MCKTNINIQPNYVVYRFIELTDNVFSDWLINYLDVILECKITPSGVERIPGAEIKLPISGHWFEVRVFKNGILGQNLLAEFIDYLTQTYKARVFRSCSNNIQLFIAVDAPVEEVRRIWGNLASKHGYDRV